MILIDLQKAFDTIDHDILLEKNALLEFLRTNKTVVQIISYKQVVFGLSWFSSPDKLSCGVPQGSNLCPLLFLLYANDMPQTVSCEFLLYADDTCLIYMGKDIKTIKDQLNMDLNSLCRWFIDDNKLSIHFEEEKTKSILFGTIKRLKIHATSIFDVRILESSNTPS